jgi:hypothetical protein
MRRLCEDTITVAHLKFKINQGSLFNQNIGDGSKKY